MSIKPINSRGPRLLQGLVVLALLAGTARPAYTWGSEGHHIIGVLSSKLLTAKTRAEVDQLLGGKSLAEVGPLPDEWRRDQPLSAGWHFVLIPRLETSYDQERDCAPQRSEVGRDCAVAAIEHFRAELANPQAPREVRARALIFLVHLVGDIHQPLHCVGSEDRGGNTVRVTFYDEPTSLHAIWDSGIILRARLSADAYAASIVAHFPQQPAADGTVVDWVNACHALAGHAYTSEGKLGDSYYQERRELVDRQLLLAGVRLAALLNDTLDRQPKPELEKMEPAPPSGPKCLTIGATSTSDYTSSPIVNFRNSCLRSSTELSHGGQPCRTFSHSSWHRAGSSERRISTSRMSSSRKGRARSCCTSQAS